MPNGKMLRTWLEISVWRHGWAIPLAMVALAIAAAIYFAAVLPDERRVAEREGESARAALALARSGPISTLERPLLSLDLLRSGLATPPQASEQIRRMTALAAVHEIVLAQAEYHQEVNTTIGVGRVQIVQPVRATYPQLREYIEAVLLEIPNASLDHLSANRAGVGESQIQVRLKWSLWTTAAASPNPGTRRTGEP